MSIGLKPDLVLTTWLVRPFGGLGSSDGGMPRIFSLLGLIYLEGTFSSGEQPIFMIASLCEPKEIAERKQPALDDLIDLANRRGFTRTGHSLIARCSAEGKPIGVAAIDLDSFKSTTALVSDGWRGAQAPCAGCTECPEGQWHHWTYRGDEVAIFCTGAIAESLAQARGNYGMDKTTDLIDNCGR